ncbi:hypothetical protein [Limosilactobacillus sp.]|uniref:hypothetical protein n=1 Tax=Limosilactobacillus sp. TaxID=2773925 RepID=UPI00359FC0C2
MKLNVADYLEQLPNARHEQIDSTAVKIQQATSIKTGLAFMQDAIDSGYLANYEWQVKVQKGDPISVRLENNLINVPMADAERLNGKLLNKDEEYPVKLYMVAEGEDLNKSNLRIDELAADAGQANNADTVAKFQSWVADQLAQLMENRADNKED